jgi:hypothetical protein
MAEHLARSHHVKHLAVIDDFNRPRSNHAQVLDWPYAFRKDCLSRGVEFDLNNPAKQFKCLGIENGKWKKLPEKLNYVRNSRHSDLLSVAIDELEVRDLRTFIQVGRELNGPSVSMRCASPALGRCDRWLS